MSRAIVPLGLTAVVATLVSMTAASQSTGGSPSDQSRSTIVHEASIAVPQPGPHGGGGETTAFPFFSQTPDFKMAFRKRILHPGSSIGYHRQDVDEVYYIISGTGEYTLNGQREQVGPGTAMLTRPGDSHGLRPSGQGELVLIVAYPLPNR